MLGRLRLSYASNSSNPRVTLVTRVPMKHQRSLAHMTLLGIDKQDQSSRQLPEAIVVWRGFTRVTDVISSDSH